MKIRQVLVPVCMLLINLILNSSLPLSPVRADQVTTKKVLSLISFFPTPLTPEQRWQQAVVNGEISCNAPVTSNPSIFLPVILKNAAGRSQTIAMTKVTQARLLPPDPRDTAPELDRSVATDIYVASQFIYSGSNPIQIEMSPDTIAPKQVAVLRGITRNRNNEPLSGVLIRVLDHPEFGCTLSRVDGTFDLVVNGGRQLTLNYEHIDYMSVQRQLNVPARNYAWLDDVVLIPYDAQVTTIDLTAPDDFQVAQGSQVTDADGTRQATLLFQKNTIARMTLPNGQRKVLDNTSLSVRATEYTVGENGVEAMPGELPPQSGYTYAVDFSVDEAIAAGAMNVEFDQPVFSYIENFLDFPVGMAVPTGYYNQIEGKWLASDNGQVIKVLAINGDLADVDTTGDEVADNGASLGMTEAERRQIAELYGEGQTLWRVPISHFTPWDCNWPYGPPPDAESPDQPPPITNEQPDEEPQECGSVIGLHSQSLGEQIEVVGTPFRLHYNSLRTVGQKAAYTVQIPLADDNPPADLKEIVLEVEVAGQRFAETFPPTPNQNHTFTWDGKDAYGRLLQGRQPVTIRTGYVYDAVYQEPAQFDQAFGAFSGVPITGSRARNEITLWQESEARIGAWDRVPQKLGAWSLNAHHVYDPASQTLYLGDGSQRSAQGMGQVISTVAGDGDNANDGDGDPATEASTFATDVAVAPDGSFYIAAGSRIRHVGLDGIISTFAGGGTPDDGMGDGGPATEAKLNSAGRIALGPDGSLYISERFEHRIRRIGPDGVITTIAGNGTAGYSGDGGLATDAQLDDPEELAIGPDGSLYIADASNHAIRRVGPDGIITTFAGNGERCDSLSPCGTGGPATEAQLTSPSGVAVAPDNTIYITQYNGDLYRIGVDGILIEITDIAGVWQGQGIAFGPDGSLYISYYWGLTGYVFRVNENGTLTTIAGNAESCSPTSDPCGDGGPATQAYFNSPEGMDVGPDGSIYVTSFNDHLVRKVGTPLSGFSTEEIAIPSKDGRLLYFFDGNGRHLRTLNALTGALMLEFGYDSQGLLTQITDGDGNVTTVERDANGNASRIIGPYGQQTNLAINDAGYLTSAANPAGEAHQFSYTENGLMLDMRDPNSKLYRYFYDSLDRLQQDADPAGGTQSLARTDFVGGYEVSHTTALSRSTLYRVEPRQSGDQVWATTFPDNTQRQTLISYRNANRTITETTGVIYTLQEDADPRFGLQAAVPQTQLVNTPGGLSLDITTQLSATLSNPQNPLSLISLDETVSVNGRQFTSAYDAANRTFTLTTAEGRQSTVQIDEQGRVVQDATPGFDPVSYTYDNRGRLEIITQGMGAKARLVTFGYDSNGYLETLTDALNRSTRFGYDAAGRVISQTLPGERTINYQYEANGNLTALTPPGRPAHAFSHTAVNLVETYTPPNVNGAGNNLTQYTYNPDRQLTQITRPDNKTLDFNYDPAGRLSVLTIPRGPISYTYEATTGNIASITTPDNLTLSYTYDGELVTDEAWAGPVTGNISYGYDDSFRLIEQSINGSQTINYQYDDDDFLIQAGDLTLSRHPQHGFLIGTSLGGVNTSQSYNTFGELATWQADYNNAGLYDTQYTYDKLGRITQKVETVQGTTLTYDYSYDPAGRLQEVKRNNAVVESYSYDANGNRLPGTYDDQDRLLQYDGAAYTYTANGELQSKTKNGQTTTYTYDVLGNLISVSLPDGKQITYLIDGQNRRVGKVENGIQTQGFLYEDALNPVAELDDSNNIVSRFVYGSRINVPDYLVREGIIYRIIADHLGSVRLVVNTQNGNIAQRIDYDVFGQVLQDTNPGFQPFGFAGGLHDMDTGLVRFGARDYDAEVGRWTAKDPVRFAGDGPNLYKYVLNNPINLMDPTGLGFWGKRPLEGFDFMINNSPQDLLNSELSHEHYFSDHYFEDISGEGFNAGQGKDGVFSEQISDGYEFNGQHYDDDIMREAIKNVEPFPYHWNPSDNMCTENCQEWADRVRNEYNRLKLCREFSWAPQCHNPPEPPCENGSPRRR